MPPWEIYLPHPAGALVVNKGFPEPSSSVSQAALPGLDQRKYGDTGSNSPTLARRRGTWPADLVELTNRYALPIVDATIIATRRHFISQAFQRTFVLERRITLEITRILVSPKSKTLLQLNIHSRIVHICFRAANTTETYLRHNWEHRNFILCNRDRDRNAK